jgi:hypothetical protein
MRAKLAKKGEAMPDGSFPIRNRTDLRNAIASVGRASDPDAARAWIIKRARALKAVHELPASWDVEDSVQAAGFFDEAKHPRHGKGDPKGGQFAPKGSGEKGDDPMSQAVADIQDSWLEGYNDARNGGASHTEAVKAGQERVDSDFDPANYFDVPGGGYRVGDSLAEQYDAAIEKADLGKMAQDAKVYMADESKLVEGPGGRMMSRTEQAELLDKQRAGTPSAKADRAAKQAREEGDTPAYLQTPDQATGDSRLEAARRSPNWNKSLDVEPPAKVSMLADKFKLHRGTRTSAEQVLASFPELSKADAKAVAKEIYRRSQLEGIRKGRIRYPETEFHV